MRVILVMLYLCTTVSFAVPPKKPAGPPAPKPTAAKPAVSAPSISGNSLAPLTGRQLKFILQDRDLLNFARELYALLAGANPNRITNPRERENRRLDAFARLLVGDETCAAVAFDGDHILIATNKNIHEKLDASWSIDIHLVPGAYYQCLLCKPWLNISFNNGPLIHIPSQEVFYRPFLPVSVYPGGNTRILAPVLRPDVDRVTFRIPPETHLIPNIPEIALPSVLSSEIPLGPRGVTIISPGVISHTQFRNMHTYLDPLRRRAEVILEHLSFVARANALPLNSELRERALQAAEANRTRVLSQSLAWEAAEWYMYQGDLRNYVDSERDNFKEQVDRFISQLCEDFSRFKKANHIVKATSSVVRAWWSTIIDRVEKDGISKPNFIRSVNEDKKFMDFAYRYFIDLEKLEAYIADDVKSQGRLTALLTQKNPSELPMILPLTPGETEEDLHAEVRILLYLLENHKSIPYIATSMLCCCHCSLVMKQFGIKEISGRHGKMFAGWVLARKFIENEEFLKRLFGERLYAEYCRLKTEHIRLPEHKRSDVGITKAEAVLRIFQSMASLDKNALRDLGIADEKLWNSEDNLADESDDEDIDSSKAAKKRKSQGEVRNHNSPPQEPVSFEFEEQLIPSTGNCWVEAVLTGTNQIHLAPPLSLNNVDSLRVEVANRLLANREQNYGRVTNSIRDIVYRAIDNDGVIEGTSEEFRSLLLPVVRRARVHGMFDRMFIEQIRFIEARTNNADNERIITLLRERQHQNDIAWQEFFDGFINENGYAAYCENLRVDRSWGGQLELEILADILGVRIEVYDDVADPSRRNRIGVRRIAGSYGFINHVYTVNPEGRNVIRILHVGGNHYNVLNARNIQVVPVLDLREELHVDENLITQTPGRIFIDPSFLSLSSSISSL